MQRVVFQQEWGCSQWRCVQDELPPRGRRLSGERLGLRCSDVDPDQCDADIDDANPAHDDADDGTDADEEQHQTFADRI